MDRKKIAALLFVMFSCNGFSQTLVNQGTYDSKSLVDTNSTSNSVSTVNTNNVNSGTITNINQTTVGSTSVNTNNNNNVNSGTMTNNNNNNNVMSGAVTYTNNNNNVNSGTQTFNNNNVNTGDMTNRNISTSTSTSNNVNTNNNINSGTMTYNNNNNSNSTSDNKNTNINTSTSTNQNNNVNTGDMTNRNINNSTSSSTSSNVNQNANVNQNVNSGDMTNRNINTSEITQRVIQPPPTAVAPAMMSGGNTDLCSTGTSGSVQTQIFGVSGGGTVRDMNCERLKLSKTLYDMGMKVAAVATMCQDRRVFDAMMAAGTPCPYEGQIGALAKASWDSNPGKIPPIDEAKIDDTYKKVGIGALLGALVFKLF